MSMNNRKDVVCTIGYKKINKSVKEYVCDKCKATIKAGSTYYRAFMGRGKDRCEMFFCTSCGKDNMTMKIS